jgi:prepilin-type N-terminal cleavage/methylation domain-containing protein
MKLRGFTLIELLVVIAIIGLLATIVLLSLNSARSKGNDTRIISDVRQLRVQLETDYTGNGGYMASFTGANSLLTTGNYSTLTADITKTGSAFNVVGTSPYAAYALYGRLLSNPSLYYCMDSAGKTNVTSATNNTVTCP